MERFAAVSFSKRFRVEPGAKVQLAEIDPADTGLAASKRAAKDALAGDVGALNDLQWALYAEGRQSLLIVLQAPDAGGKDGTIRKIFTAFNPQGCHVQSFKVPSTLERAHDFLWRVHPHAPPRGGVTIFNRSHYEDVLVVRVRNLAPEAVWRPRYDHINAFERLLADSGTRILKFYLHISKEEQLARFAARLDDPTKNWKISEVDYEERAYWDDYVSAFEETFERCSTDIAPWYVIPADRKWYRNLVIARIVREEMEAMNFQMPRPTVDLEDIRSRYVSEVAASEGE
jgi:PPK2 family polyphosphate:nucleotide phosphotransferase